MQLAKKEQCRVLGKTEYVCACMHVRVLEPGAGTASGDGAIGGGECKTLAGSEQYPFGLVGQGIRLSGVSNCAKLAEYIFVCQRTDV